VSAGACSGPNVARRRLGHVALVAASAVALTGCSQVAAIAPVGGARESEVRYAAIDVLMDAGVDLLTAPVCTPADAERVIRCAGETLDGEPIDVHSPGDAPDTLTVTVGERTLYSGSTHDVLEAAMRG